MKQNIFKYNNYENIHKLYILIKRKKGAPVFGRSLHLPAPGDSCAETALYSDGYMPVTFLKVLEK